MGARKLRWRKDGKRNLSIEDAVWQYILDHVAEIGPNGFLVCKIGITSRSDFTSSIQARREGLYRWSEDDIVAMYTKLYSKKGKKKIVFSVEHAKANK